MIISMQLNNRRLEKRMLAGCIGAITWQTNPDMEFLQTDDIDAAKSSLTTLAENFDQIADAFSDVNEITETAFSYNGAYPIQNEAQGLANTIDNIGTSLSELVSSISGKATTHQKNEAIQFYNKVKEHLVELDNNIQGALENYNYKLSYAKIAYVCSCGEPPLNDPNYYHNLAEQMFGPPISVSSPGPSSDLSTIVSIPASYQADIDGGNLGAAVEEYNLVASTQGAAAERYRKTRGITGYEISSQRSSYSSVSPQEISLDASYVGHGDIHYLGTMNCLDDDGQQIMDPMGNPLTQDVFYDADDPEGKAYIVVEGEKCYLSNTQYIRSYNDTRGIGFVNGEFMSGDTIDYYIGIGLNADGTPVDPNSHEYNNNAGTYSNKVHAMSPSGTTMHFDWTSMQYTGLENDDDSDTGRASGGFRGSGGGKF